eukprot:2546100-Pyramimonas_sp.AAC.1
MLMIIDVDDCVCLAPDLVPTIPQPGGPIAELHADAPTDEISRAAVRNVWCGRMFQRPPLEPRHRAVRSGGAGDR